MKKKVAEVDELSEIQLQIISAKQETNRMEHIKKDKEKMVGDVDILKRTVREQELIIEKMMKNKQRLHDEYEQTHSGT